MAKYPPVVFIVALGVMVLFNFAIPAAHFIPAPYRYAGSALIVLGFALGIWALGQFRLARTPTHPHRNPTRLVVTGPYRFSRNPMYLGLALVLVGAAIDMGSITPFVVIPAFVALVNERFIVPEEARLEAAFGDSFRAYKARVRRWI